MGLIESGQLTPAGATTALVVMLVAMTAGAAYCWWTLRREARGHEIHAHADGTVHEHWRGSKNHAHPTFSERYTGRLTTWFGPAQVEVTRAPAEEHGTPVAD
jgi:hypothetical protein